MVSYLVICSMLMAWPSYVQGVNLIGSDLAASAGDPFTLTCTWNHTILYRRHMWTVRLGSMTEIDNFDWLRQENCRPIGFAVSQYFRIICFPKRRFHNTLTIPNVDYEIYHRSKWTCDISSRESNILTLEVNVPLTEVEITNYTDSPLTVTENELVNLECTTNPTRPPTNISWSKDGQIFTQGLSTITTDDDGRTVTVSTLTFTTTCADHLTGVRCTGEYEEKRIMSPQLGLFVHCNTGQSIDGKDYIPEDQRGTASGSDLGFGYGVGVGIAACLVPVGVAAAILLCLRRRSATGRNGGKDSPPDSGDQDVARQTTDASAAPSTYDRVDPSAIETTDPSNYESLKIYENTLM